MLIETAIMYMMTEWTELWITRNGKMRGWERKELVGWKSVVQLILVAQLDAHVVHLLLGERFQVALELVELAVGRIFVPGLDRDAIFQVVGEGLRRVVDNDRLGQVAAQDRQILRNAWSPKQAGE